MSHLYQQIARNKRHSWILVIVMSFIFMAAGFSLGNYYGDPWIGLVIAFGFAFFYSLISFSTGDRMVLASMRARPADPKQHQQLLNIVQEMSLASGLPPPKVYVIETDASNAFATGNSPEKASIAVTTGLMEVLNREELQAVIGHEMAHIKNFDTRFAVLMGVMVGSIILLSDTFLRMGLFGGRRRSSSRDQGGSSGLLAVVALLFAIIAPLLAKVIQLAMSRRRELLADNTSAELTRNPLALASALEKIAGDPDPIDLRNRGVQHLFIVNPVKTLQAHRHHRDPKQEKSGWFDTHPPIALRVRLLRELGHQSMGVSGSK